MKKILYIFLTLSILSTGCSKEDDDTIQVTQETISSLDENLYGVWKKNGTSTLDYFRTFSSNGKSNFWVDNNGSQSSNWSGDWWVENDILLLSSGYSLRYTISGNTLTFPDLMNPETWTKQ
tara:strand:- start:300 stop:662 length:363 start_codon:yes stop_codon:yes gene_type:complete